ncbi:MAG: hypothetical protein AB3N13_14660 [Arenibacterium sp.]
MAHVLIGFAEALPAPEVVFSLRQAGHKVSAFARRPDLPIRELLSQLHVLPAPEDSIAQCVSAIEALMMGEDAPDYVLPMDDAALWLSASLSSATRIAGATGASVTAALDKSIQVKHARAAGLSVPPTWEAYELPLSLPDLPYPVIAKPALAVHGRDGKLGKDDAVYLPDRQAATDFQAGRGPKSDPFLIQPLIRGQGEGVFGFVGPDGVAGWSGHRRLRMMNPHGSGSSACVSFYPDEALCARVERFLKALNWKGAFMVELLRDANGTAWFMELNGRMWGSMALARRQGLEYPAWAVAQAMNADFAPVAPEPVHRPMTQRHLGRDLLHLLFTLRGPKSEFHKADWPSLWRSLPGVLKPARGRAFYNFDPDFPRYFLKDAAWTVKKALKR